MSFLQASGWLSFSRLQKTWLLLSYLIFFGLIILLGIAGAQRWLRVKNVECSAANESCPDYVVAELEKMKGKFLFSDFRPIAARVPQFLPSYQLVKVQTQWPESITVQFSPADIAYGVSASSKQPLLIDASGTIISAQQDRPAVQTLIIQIPESLYEQLSLREMFPSHLHDAVMLLQTRMSAEKTALQQVTFLDTQQIQVRVKNGHQYVLPVLEMARAVEQLFYIEKNWSQLPPEFQVQQVDLRFHYPLISTKTEKDSSSSANEKDKVDSSQ